MEDLIKVHETRGLPGVVEELDGFFRDREVQFGPNLHNTIKDMQRALTDMQTRLQTLEDTVHQPPSPQPVESPAMPVVKGD